MRNVLPVLAVLCSVRAHAYADPAAGAESAPVAETPSLRFALAVNAPLGWATHSFGVSGYVRLNEHLAVRGNLASYQNSEALKGTIGAITGNDGTGYGGTILDVGIAGVWYPRRVWDGFLLEVGALRLERNVYVWPESESKTFTRSIEYAGRALVGWSWLIHQRAFIAIAAGLSVGHESGNDTTTPDGMPTITKPVHRGRSDGEGYIRIGVMFGD
jgi:hypothetical protein